MKRILNIIKNYFKGRRLLLITSTTLYVLSAALAMLPAKLLQLTIDEGFIKADVSALLFFIALLFIAYILKALFTYISNRGLIEIGNGLLKKVKGEIYSRLMSMDLSFYSNNDIGYINARVEEISSIDVLFSTQTLTLLSSLLEFILALVILYSLNWKVLAILSIPIPFLLIISYIASKKISKQVKESLDSSAEYQGKMQDTLRGMETVKSQGLEKKESEKINQYNQTALDKQKKQSHTLNGFSVGMGSVGSVITVIIYLVGGLFYIAGELTMGSFIAISTYAMKLYSPILSYAGMSVMIQPAYMALKRVAEFFFNDKDKKTSGEETTINKIGSIEFNNIHFSYQEDEKLLYGFNLKISEGDKIHIVGPNGSGKSTLIRLLLKLHEPTKGSILINDINLFKIDRSSLINQISYVSQRNYVFNESVEDNIKYGIDSPDHNLYESIVKGLHLTEIIERLADEGDEKIGENGARLSGGEIQKICLARALLLNKKVFILDEALTNLDKESFQYFMNIIAQSDGTWIVVDHQTELKKYGFLEVPIRN